MNEELIYNGNGDLSSHLPERKSTKSSHVEKLVASLERKQGKSHLILLLGTPDPDAISSALALEFICNEFDVQSTIMCFSPVSHHENRALVKRLGITLQKYSPECDLSSYHCYSIVDSQKWSTPIDAKLDEARIPLFCFIDHHREDLIPPHAEIVDIRPQYGCTATILVEYLRELYPQGLSPSDPNQVKLATALMHGLRTDTQRFMLATQEDFEAASFLAPCLDSAVIELIERKVLTPSMLDMFESALVSRKVHDNFIFADVGYARETDRDGIPQIAELLLAREGTDTVLVFGIIEEQVIDGSLRTRSETINPDEFLKGFLGVSPENGRPYGGGNIRDRGGFQIPLGFFSMHEDKGMVYQMAKNIVEKSFLDYIGKTGTKSRKK